MKHINYITLLLVVVTFSFSVNYSFPQVTWFQKADFPINKDAAVSFSIGTKGYIGTGLGTSDLWEWDQLTNTWTQKAGMPGGRSHAVGFSIGNKGYIGTGIYGHGFLRNDFWEWDQSTDTWTQKARFPKQLAFAVGFAIGTKGYIVTGLDFGDDLPELWEWDQSTDTWTQKTSFPGGIRTNAVAFTIENKAYIGTGSDSISRKDFWEWDQSTDTWARKSDFPGGVREGAVGFSIDNKGYIGLGYGVNGYKNDFWEWNQNTDTWTRLPDLPAAPRLLSCGFSIKAKGYVGSGSNGGNENPAMSYPRDFWEFSPPDSTVSPLTSIDFKNINEDIIIYPNPTQGEFTIDYNKPGEQTVKLKIFNTVGGCVYSQSHSDFNNHLHDLIDISREAKGIYILEIVGKKSIYTKKLVLN